MVGRPDDLVGGEIIVDVNVKGLSGNNSISFEVEGECVHCPPPLLY